MPAGIPENLLPMVPRAVVAYALDCITEDGELESPLIDGHPGPPPTPLTYPLDFSHR